MKGETEFQQPTTRGRGGLSEVGRASGTGTEEMGVEVRFWAGGIEIDARGMEE